MLKILPAAFKTICDHAQEGYPLEICGMLAGIAKGEIRIIKEAWPLRNAWEENPELRASMTEALAQAGGTATAGEWESEDSGRRFLVSPDDLLKCMRRAREAGMDLAGVYHTHPNHPAVPSGFDRDAAWEGWSYIILSVEDGHIAEFRSWSLGASGEFVEEDVEAA